jgi:MFS transporter, MHS family, proline/betaine transporter
MSHPSRARVIAGCTIGNALEFFDFVVFSFFARIIGALFFPQADPTAQLLFAFLIYGVGFFMRPLGGIIMGAYADKKGRKKATLVTLTLMALGTGLIGCAPTYAQIGVFAPVLIVIGRLIQGFSAGGEVGASTTLLVESAPEGKRGFYGAWQGASQGLGVALAAAISLYIMGTMAPADVNSYGWRIPFLLGILILPIGLWLRSVLEETHANDNDAKTRDTLAISEIFNQHLGKVLTGTGLIIGGTATTAIVSLYMATYAVVNLKLPPAAGLLTGITGGLIAFFLSPWIGQLSDKIGRKPFIFWGYLLMALLIYPAFLFINHEPTMGKFLLTIAALQLLNVVAGTPVIFTLVELFPRTVRATGMSLVYALGVAIFGGFGQAIVTWLIGATGNPLSPAFYVIACIMMTMVALRFMPELSKAKI